MNFANISTKPELEIKKLIDEFFEENDRGPARKQLLLIEIDMILFLHQHLKMVDLELWYASQKC